MNEKIEVIVTKIRFGCDTVVQDISGRSYVVFEDYIRNAHPEIGAVGYIRNNKFGMWDLHLEEEETS